MADRDRPELTVEQALEHILANVAVLSSERVSALDAIGRVLAEPVEAKFKVYE